MTRATISGLCGWPKYEMEWAFSEIANEVKFPGEAFIISGATRDMDIISETIGAQEYDTTTFSDV